MSSIALTVGGLIASAFVNTLVEKASSYTLQQLGQRSDLHDEVHWLRSSLLKASAVLCIAERKQQRNKDDEERLRELLLKLKDAAYDAKDFFGDLDYEVLRRKVVSSFFSFAANFFKSGNHAAKARGVRKRLDDVSNEMEKIIGVLNSDVGGRQHEMPARKPKSSL